MDTLSTAIASPLAKPLFVPCLTALGVILLLIAFWRRAYSLHAPWERVWRLIAGGAEVQEPRLRAFMQEMRDLEKFRLVYGLKVTNLRDLHKLIGLVRRYRLDMSDLQKAKKWIDASKPEIVSLPPKHFYFWNGAGYFSALFFAVAMVLLLGSPGLFKGNTSGVWFATDGDTIRHVYSSTSYKLDKCTWDLPELKNAFQLADNELKSICSGRADGTLKVQVSKAVSEQRMVSALGLGFAVWALITTAVRMRSGRAAELLALQIGQIAPRPSEAKENALPYSELAAEAPSGRATACKPCNTDALGGKSEKIAP